MPVNALEVDFLFTISAAVSIEPHARIKNGPHGTRVIADVTGGTFDGPRLRGHVVAPGGDWLHLRANGTAQLDVRLLLVTDDGASILMAYKGINRDGGAYVRTAPLFETGDERYSWLNDIQAVATGQRTAEGVTYDVYALR